MTSIAFTACIHSLDVDEDSDQNLDLLPCLKRQLGYLKEAFAHMGLVPNSHDYPTKFLKYQKKAELGLHGLISLIYTNIR